jgi:hypothetical protein
VRRSKKRAAAALRGPSAGVLAKTNAWSQAWAGEGPALLRR